MSDIRTWGQALDWQWKFWKRLPSAKTNQINSNHITRHVGRSFPISKMGKAGFWKELQLDLLEEGRSSSTVNRIVSAGTTVLHETYLAGLHATAKPAFRRLKEGEHRLTWFSKDQVEKLAAASRNVFSREDLADAILFSAYTGIRQGELLKLKGQDIDLEHGCIWIGGKPDQVTKGKNVRAVPISDRIKDICSARLSQKHAFEFDNKDQLYGAFKKVRKYCDIPEDHVWHSLRHSFGTWLGEVTHPKQIQALMGHADITTTLRYVKPTDEANRAAIAAL